MRHRHPQSNSWISLSGDRRPWTVLLAICLGSPSCTKCRLGAQPTKIPIIPAIINTNRGSFYSSPPSFLRNISEIFDDMCLLFSLKTGITLQKLVLLRSDHDSKICIARLREPIIIGQIYAYFIWYCVCQNKDCMRHVKPKWGESLCPPLHVTATDITKQHIYA